MRRRVTVEVWWAGLGSNGRESWWAGLGLRAGARRSAGGTPCTNEQARGLPILEESRQVTPDPVCRRRWRLCAARSPVVLRGPERPRNGAKAPGMWMSAPETRAERSKTETTAWHLGSGVARKVGSSSANSTAGGGFGAVIPVRCCPEIPRIMCSTSHWGLYSNRHVQFAQYRETQAWT